MPKAIWNGEVIAESDDTVVVEGNHYFPAESVRAGVIAASGERTYCPWKGHASYYDLVVGGERNAGAVWYYPDPMPEAAMVADRVAFWRGVTVEP